MPVDRKVLRQKLLDWLAQPNQPLPPDETWLFMRAFIRERVEWLLSQRKDLVEDAISRIEGAEHVNRKSIFRRLREAHALHELREPLTFLAVALRHDAMDVMDRHKNLCFRTEADSEDGSAGDWLYESVAPPTINSGQFREVPRAVHGTLQSLRALAQARSIVDGGDRRTIKRAGCAAGHLKRDLLLGSKRLRWADDAEAPDGQIRAWQATYYAHVLDNDDVVEAASYTEAGEVPENGVDKARYDRFRTHLKRFRELWQAGKTLGLDGSTRSGGPWWDPPTHKTLGDKW